MDAQSRLHQPRASVGMPVYNGAKTLAAVVEAVRRQTLADIEIIISDNGSTDATADICLQAARTDPRVRYYRQPLTVNPTENFRFVLAQARAPFFMWAAHDDFRDDDYIEKLIAAFEGNPRVILACGDVVEVTDGVERPIHLDYDTIGISRTQRLYKAAMLQLHHLYGVWRTDELRKIQWRHCDWWHDTPLMMAASQIGNFKYVPGPRFYYMFTPQRWFFGWQRRPGLSGLIFDLKEFVRRVSSLFEMIWTSGRAVFAVSGFWYAALAMIFASAKIYLQIFHFVKSRLGRLFQRALGA